MVVPVHYLTRSFRLSSSISTIEQRQQQKMKPIARELVLHSITLVALFFFNFYEHMTGYVGPPSIQTFGTVNTNMLAALLYNLWWTKTIREKNSNSNKKNNIVVTKTEVVAHKDITRERNDDSMICSTSMATCSKGSLYLSPPLLSSSLKAPSPQAITFLLITFSIMSLLIGFILDASWEKVMIENVLSPLVSVYVILTMGRLSYLYDKKYPNNYGQKQHGQQQKVHSKDVFSIFRIWKMACISFVIMIPGVELESSLCRNLDADDVRQMVFSRFYHSIFLHFIIPSTFFFVCECTFRLVEIELHLSTGINDGNKKLK